MTTIHSVRILWNIIGPWLHTGFSGIVAKYQSFCFSCPSFVYPTPCLRCMTRTGVTRWRWHNPPLNNHTLETEKNKWTGNFYSEPHTRGHTEHRALSEHTEGTSQLCANIVSFLVEVIGKLIPEGHTHKQQNARKRNEADARTRGEEEHLWS